MIVALLKLKPIPENCQAILDTLQYVQDRVQMKPGCLDCSIYQGCSQDSVILYLEQWQSKEAMGRHIQSGTYLRVLNSMDLCRDKPDIRFYEVSGTKGMEWIAALRLENERVHPAKEVSKT